MYCVNSHYSPIYNTDYIFSIVWASSSRGYHHPGSQCVGTDMVYEIYILLKFTVPI